MTGKFAAYSVKNGMRAAFLEFFADQSWLLRPEPVDAKTWVGARPDPAIVLDWKSQITILSASGDLGFSTGPSMYRSKSDLKAPAAHGPTATPDALPATLLVALDLMAKTPAAAASADDAERQFIALGSMAYGDAITLRTRLLREGQFPIDGTAAIGVRHDGFKRDVAGFTQTSSGTGAPLQRFSVCKPHRSWSFVKAFKFRHSRAG